MRNKLVILDRDGVINRPPSPGVRYILSVEHLHVDEALISAVAKLQNRGVKFAVATNQQGIAKGLISKSEICEIHEAINNLITKIGGENIPFFICPHSNKSGCECRKPKPGLLRQAMSHFGTNLEDTIFVGDQDSDLLAAINAGIKFVPHQFGNSETLKIIEELLLIKRDAY